MDLAPNVAPPLPRAPIASPQVTNEEEEEFDLEPPPPKITKYEDAIAALEDVRVFMDNNGHPEEATRLTFMVDKLIQLHTASLCHGKQSTHKSSFSL